MFVRKSIKNPFAQPKTVQNPISNMVGRQMPEHTSVRPPISMMDTRINTEVVDTCQVDEDLSVLLFDPISVDLSLDCDIFKVDSKVKEYIKLNIQRVAFLKKSIRAARELSVGSKDHNNIQKYDRRIKDMQKEIIKIQSISLLDYMTRTMDILENYKSYQNHGIVVMGSEQRVDWKKNYEKLQLIESYLDIALEYCPVIHIEKSPQYSGCDECGDILVDNGFNFMCQNCNSIKELYGEQEDNRGFIILSSKKSGVSDIVDNFRKIISQFQIIYMVTIPDKVIDPIKETIKNYRGFDLKTMTKVDLVKIMKECGINSIWYKHLNKIYYLLTGKKPMKISQYVNNLIKRCECIAEVYDQVKDPDRSNFMHGLYLLWILLKNEGCEPDPDDFVLLKSRSVEVDNIKTLQRAFDILSVEHPEFTWKIFEIG